MCQINKNFLKPKPSLRSDWPNQIRKILLSLSSSFKESLIHALLHFRHKKCKLMQYFTTVAKSGVIKVLFITAITLNDTFCTQIIWNIAIPPYFLIQNMLLKFQLLKKEYFWITFWYIIILQNWLYKRFCMTLSLNFFIAV